MYAVGGVGGYQLAGFLLQHIVIDHAKQMSDHTVELIFRLVPKAPSALFVQGHTVLQEVVQQTVVPVVRKKFLPSGKDQIDTKTGIVAIVLCRDKNVVSLFHMKHLLNNCDRNELLSWLPFKDPLARSPLAEGGSWSVLPPALVS